MVLMMYNLYDHTNYFNRYILNEWGLEYSFPPKFIISKATIRWNPPPQELDQS